MLLIQKQNELVNSKYPYPLLLEDSLPQRRQKNTVNTGFIPQLFQSLPPLPRFNQALLIKLKHK